MTSDDNSIELSDEIEVVGPGLMLKEARQQLGWSQKQVAEKLNFRTILIEQIESENFDDATPATFTRGYLRNYAKLVQVAEEDVLAAYEHLGVAERYASKMQSFSQGERKKAENKMIMALTYTMIILVLGLTGLWWYQKLPNGSLLNSVTNTSAGHLAEQVVQDGRTQPSKNTDEIKTSVLNNQASVESATLAPVAENQNKALIDSSGDSSSENSTTPSPADLYVELESQTPVLASAAPQTGSAALADNSARNEQANVIAVEPVPVSFFFRGDCWVNIYDATGERIAWGVKKADYTMNIRGIAPFKVTLGKPELVEVEFDGEPVDISHFKSGHIAKFELPLSE